MPNDSEIWRFASSRLQSGQSVVLMIVAESFGSSPGRAGYKMAVGADGELFGSIGGGVMEVALVERAKVVLSEPGAVATGFLVNQVHRKDAANASGMICSGKQTVIFKQLDESDLKTVEAIIDIIKKRGGKKLQITPETICIGPPEGGTPNESETPNAGRNALLNESAAMQKPARSKGETPRKGEVRAFYFEKNSDTEFLYEEKLGYKNSLVIIGGGHCALALSGLMSKMDFHISIFDDRPELNTIDKNRFAHEIKIIENYEDIGGEIASDPNTYVVVMTLGYKSDEVVIRRLIDHEFKYFGVLGSKAKMKTLLAALAKDGFSKEKLGRIHTPIGLPINSRTPEEIAVSIAAEIIAVKNADLHT
ncbi:MAG: XdhC family protein [Pyrinomonadaceae bacterium]